MPTMEARLELADQLDAADHKFKTVNSIPAVISARKKSDDARRASDNAQREFTKIFNAHTTNGLAARLAKVYPGAVLLGGDGLEDDFKWIARCAITRLPIFAGDLVYFYGDEEDHQKSYILAEAVTLSPDYEATPVVIDIHGDVVPTKVLQRSK
jgi:hypothetical protein